MLPGIPAFPPNQSIQSKTNIQIKIVINNPSIGLFIKNSPSYKLVPVKATEVYRLTSARKLLMIGHRCNEHTIHVMD